MNTKNKFIAFTASAALLAGCSVFDPIEDPTITPPPPVPTMTTSYVIDSPVDPASADLYVYYADDVANPEILPLTSTVNLHVASAERFENEPARLISYIGFGSPVPMYEIGRMEGGLVSLKLDAAGDLQLRSDDTYDGLINAVGEFYLIGSNLAANCLQEYDLYFDLGLGETREPIATDAVPFAGVYDGGGKQIKNLVIDQPAANYVGLFASIEGGTVSNLTIDDGSSISGGSGVGAFCGSVYEGTFENCVNYADVQGTGNYIAGIAGITDAMYTTSFEVTNCKNYGEISGAAYPAGIAGNATGVDKTLVVVSGCSNYGAISGTGQGASGIVGSNYGTVTACANEGDIYGEGYYASGIVGYNGATGKVEDCTNSGDVESIQTNAGGVAGVNYGTVQDCINNGGVESTLAYVGGITSNNQSGATIKDCVNNGNVTSGQYYSGGISGRNSGTLLDCVNNGDVTANGVTSTWYCYVAGITGTSSTNISGCSNSGTITGILGAVGGIIGYSSNILIDDCTNTGNINAQSYVGGIAGYLYRSTTTTTGITNCSNSGTITATGTYGLLGQAQYLVSIAGGIIGNAQGTTTSGVAITNCSNTGDVVSNGDRAGGIVGFNNIKAAVSNCTNTGDVTVSNADESYSGGIVGQNHQSTVTACANYGDVTGKRYTGGVVGNNGSTGALTTQCINHGAVYGTIATGGVVGHHGNGAGISYSYNTGNVTGDPTTGSGVGGVVGFILTNNCTVVECYSTGNVTSPSPNGGVIGSNNGGSTIGSNYWTGTISSGVGVGAGAAGGVAQFTDSSWPTWVVDPTGVAGKWKSLGSYATGTYPVLYWEPES